LTEERAEAPDVMRVSIRKATPDDAQFLAWVILTASRGHLSKGWFDIALNQPESCCLEFLRRLTIAACLSRWHYSRFLVAESGSSAAAALCAFCPRDAYMASPPAVTEVARSLGIPGVEQARIWERGSYQFKCARRPGDDSWVIESIATLPGYRQRGCTTQLLATALAEGRDRGLRMAEISTAIGNGAAESAYLKAGFRLACELRHPDFEAICGSAGQRRFVRRLDVAEDLTPCGITATGPTVTGTDCVIDHTRGCECRATR
jgi:ribosomal protein S18 acetylase RimI-like enzyme